jgi:hypothetical protein
MADDKDKRTPLTALREAWFALTGALSSAESEVQKRFYESLGLQPDANLAAEIVSRVKKNREEFERKIDEGVKATIARVRAPIDSEIASLKLRIEKLSEKIDSAKLKRKKKDEQ